MSKRLVVFTVIIVILLVLAGTWIGSFISSKRSGASGYTAVFLVSGDVYFGKLSWFPWPRLKNAWTLQRVVDEKNQPQLSLAPFKSVFWGPAGDVYLNPKQILFWAPIAPDSQVAKTIENPQSIQQQQPQIGQPQPQQVPPSGEKAKK